MQEHRQVANFHGTQPKEILSIPKSHCTLKDTSFPDLLNSFYGVIILQKSAYIFLLTQPHQTYRKLQLPGRQWIIQGYEVTVYWPEGHTSEVWSKRTEDMVVFLLDNSTTNILPDRRRNGLQKIFTEEMIKWMKGSYYDSMLQVRKLGHSEGQSFVKRVKLRQSDSRAQTLTTRQLPPAKQGLGCLSDFF